MSWQRPQQPPPDQRRGWSGIDPDSTSGCWQVPACCLLESLTYCCWWPALLALALLAALLPACVMLRS